jgi:D-tyrosyl-tRNA(Tyr) deacylase
MRAVVQRVSRARVRVNGLTTGEIGAGLLILLGVGQGDTSREADYMLDKIINLRIFEDGEGKMNLSLLETGGQLMVISQFTLYADCRKGRRPSFTDAAPPGEAQKLYDGFVNAARNRGMQVATGIFQTLMEVELVNSGPVTILLDTSKNS